MESASFAARYERDFPRIGALIARGGGFALGKVRWEVMGFVFWVEGTEISSARLSISFEGIVKGLWSYICSSSPSC